VAAIRTLAPEPQSQGSYELIISTQPPRLTFTVIDAYARSLKVTFISAIAVFVIVNALVLPIKLPNLKRKRQSEEEEQNASPPRAAGASAGVGSETP
jgi:fucose permease